MGEERGAEKALLAAVPGALRCPPDSRKGFDVVAWQAISAAVTTATGSIEVELEQATRDRDYAEAEALGVWAIADVQRDRLKELTSCQQEAKAFLQEREREEEAATQAAAAEILAVRTARASQSSAESRASQTAAALASFQQLRDPPAPV